MTLAEVLNHASWHNAPPNWEMTDEMLTVTTGNETDFWQDTYYGFRRDNGHFFGREVEADFSAVVAFEQD